MEFHEIKPAESGRILVLLAAREGEILAFDLIRQTGRFVVAEGEVHPFREAFEDADDHRRRRTQAGTGRRVVVRCNPEGSGDGSIIPDDPLIDTTDEVRSRVERPVQWAVEMRLTIVRIDPYPTPFLRFNRAVSGQVDGGIEDLSPVQVTVGRDVAPPSCEPQPQRRFASDNHNYTCTNRTNLAIFVEIINDERRSAILYRNGNHPAVPGL